MVAHVCSHSTRKEIQDWELKASSCDIAMPKANLISMSPECGLGREMNSGTWRQS